MSVRSRAWLTNSNFLTPVKAHNLNNVELKFLGNMHLPENMTYVQELGECLDWCLG